MKVYLDSSAIVKRYVEERGSTIVRKVYREAYSGSATLTVSAWNIGEVLGVFNKYRRRGWLSEEGYTEALRTFASETSRLIKLGVMSLVPVRTSILIASWSLTLKHNIYQADALQVVSAKHAGADIFYTGDRELAKVASSEGLKVRCLED